MTAARHLVRAPHRQQRKKKKKNLMHEMHEYFIFSAVLQSIISVVSVAAATCDLSCLPAKFCVRPTRIRLCVQFCSCCTTSLFSVVFVPFIPHYSLVFCFSVFPWPRLPSFAYIYGCAQKFKLPFTCTCPFRIRIAGASFHGFPLPRSLQKCTAWFRELRMVRFLHIPSSQRGYVQSAASRIPFH